MIETPSAPVLEACGSDSILLTIGPDNNSSNVRYAVFVETLGLWAGGGDSFSIEPLLLTREEWEYEPLISGLTPSTLYVFKVKARLGETTTDFGPSAGEYTYNIGSVVMNTFFEVKKSSATVSPPHFLESRNSVLRIAGKDLSDFGFIIDNVSGLEDIQGVTREEIVPGESAWRIWDEHFAPRRIRAEGYIHGDSQEDAVMRLGCLKSFLAPFFPGSTSTPAVLEHSSHPEKTWLVHLHSIKVQGALGKQSHSTSLKLAVELTAPEPFSVSKDSTARMFVPVEHGFYPVELGNAPSEAVYVIKGPSSDPSFVVGDMLFYTDFGCGMEYRGIDNEKGYGEFSPQGGEGASVVSTPLGMGLSLAGSQNVSYQAVGNPLDGAWVVVFWPGFASSEGAGIFNLLEHSSPYGGSLRIYWKPAERKWTLDIGSEEISTTPQSFLSGERIVLGVIWDTTNAGGMRIYVNGTCEASAPFHSNLSSIPTLLELHTGMPILPHVVYGLVAGWSRMLSTDEMGSIASDPMSVANMNRVFSAELDLENGDLLFLDSRVKTATMFDVSENSFANVIASIQGDIPVLMPGRKKSASVNTQTVVYTRSVASLMEIKYRKRYL